MNKKNKLRPIGTRFKMIREPFGDSIELFNRCIEWEVIGHVKVFASKIDKKGEWQEKIKMISEEIIIE